MPSSGCRCEASRATCGPARRRCATARASSCAGTARERTAPPPPGPARAGRWRDGRGVLLRWYGSIEDVPARREAVERLRESEETHRLTLELMRQIIWTTLPGGGGIEFSARYRELTGMSEDEDASL